MIDMTDRPTRRWDSRSTQLLRTTLMAAAVTAAYLNASPCLSQATSLGAGESPAAGMPAKTVPRLIKYSGALMDERGYPITVPVEVTFSLYDTASPTQKSALWKETQRVSPNEKGQYTIYLGEAGSQGLPPEVFNSLSAQWLGVEVEGDAELPRTLLASVPYAIKAGDAQTLGGLPASAFALARSAASASSEPAIAVPPRW